MSRTSVPIAVLSGIGARIEGGLAYLGGLAELVGASLAALPFSPLKRARTFDRTVHQAMAVGVRAVPIITLITFFVGVILALQALTDRSAWACNWWRAWWPSRSPAAGPLGAIVVTGRWRPSRRRLAQCASARNSTPPRPWRSIRAFLVTPKIAAMVIMMPCSPSGRT
jgi:phospholipid/cholesterol/gamma-HCH transport system permease protein